MDESPDILRERIEINPFQPNREVSPDRFCGRRQEISELRRTLVYASRGNARNHAVVGDRGIGKTSLLNFIKKVAPQLEDFIDVSPPLFVTCSLGACGSVEDIASTILDSIFAASTTNASVYERLRDFFDEIDAVTASGFGISFRSQDSRKAAIQFPMLLRDVHQRLEQEYSALVLILDETDRIAELRGFPDFVKATVEQIRREGVENVSLILSAIPAAWEKMNENNPSFARIFYVEPLAPLSPEEVKEFLAKSLQRGIPKKEASDEFEDLYLKLSEGVPAFFQHLGYYSFEHDDDNFLDEDDLFRGLMGTNSKPGALEQLEQKLFRNLYVKLVQSNTYREILHIMASSEQRRVEIGDIKDQIQGTEPEQVSSYVGNMVKRGVIKKVEGKRGVYELPNVAFKIFLRIKAIEEQRR